MEGAAERQCQCGVRLSVRAEKEGDDNGGLADGEGGPADGRGRLALKKIVGTGDKSRRIELPRGETMEENLPFRRKCEPLEVSPSTVYSRRQMRIGRRNEEDIELARKIEDIYLRWPFHGSRRMAQEISRQGTPVNRKRVQRLMQKMGLVGVAPGPKTSKPHPRHKKHPCLLKDVKITRPNQVWSCDIAYIPTRFGFLYLAAVMDWHSRRILACRLSTTMDVAFCTEALEEGSESSVLLKSSTPTGERSSPPTPSSEYSRRMA